ncbi:MAG TPA: hypothetical protein VGJ32_01880 [Solirubrobacteraceae bacterium]
MTVRVGIAAALVVGTFAVGCGDGDGKESDKGQTQATPQRAVAELGEVRKGLDQALDAYRSGERAAADRQVGDTYLEHFEIVEGPLGEVDHELTEKLEDGIREELRAKIKSGAPAAEVMRLGDEIMRDLERAEAALR